MAAAIENVGAAIVQWRRPMNGRRHFTGTRDLTRLKSVSVSKWRSPSVQTKTIDLVIGILLHYKHSYTMMFYQFVLITTRLKHMWQEPCMGITFPLLFRDYDPPMQRPLVLFVYYL